MNAFLLKIRNKILFHLAQGGKDEIEGINTQEQYDAAGYDSILFHVIMKWPLREIIRVLPDIPEKWIENLTGSRKLMYQIGKDCWYDVDGNAERKQKLWKPFLYFLVLWQNDEVLEPADRVLYEVLKRRDQFYINLGNLDPINWWMNNNPRLADNKAGRCACIFSEDPEIRWDSISQRSIVLANPPRRNFFKIGRASCRERV